MKKLFFLLIGLAMLFSFNLNEISMESSKSPPLTAIVSDGESMQVMTFPANSHRNWLTPSIGGLDVKKDFCFGSLSTRNINAEIKLDNNVSDFTMITKKDVAWTTRGKTTCILKLLITA